MRVMRGESDIKSAEREKVRVRVICGRRMIVRVVSGRRGMIGGRVIVRMINGGE